MQKLINTKLVRKLVRSIAGDSIYGKSYTDINLTDSDLRNVTFLCTSTKHKRLLQNCKRYLHLQATLTK